MIVQEPVQAAIWHCLNYYDYQDAIFLAERLHSEIGSEESVFLLATCYYRSGDVHQAYWLLKSQGTISPQSKYLLSKCAYDLKKYQDAETALSSVENLRQMNFDELCKEFGEIACFALQLLAKICQHTEQLSFANEANKRALNLNPFLWSSFANLCSRGEKPDPNSIFKITNYDIFATCQCANASSMVVLDNGGDTIIKHILNDISSPNDCIIQTPNNNINLMRGGLCVGGMGGGYNIGTSGVNIIEDTPLSDNLGEELHSVGGTPFKKHFKYLSTISPSTPSFGVLPFTSPDTSTSIFSPTSQTHQQQQQQHQLQVQQQQQTLIEMNNSEQKSLGKKLKGHVGSLINRKDTPLQQTKPVFNQTGNITPRLPNSLTGQNVRRSSRLFSSNNYSVKENSKSPIINKFAAPRSPPRKSKQRTKMNLNNTALNDMINEKQQKEKIETITSSHNDSKVLLNNCINGAQNFAQQILDMKKDSADGLMALLRDLGKGYQLLSQYECKNAIECFSAIPLHHHNSSWVQSMLALSNYELRDYNAAANIFKSIHEKEPFRLEYMDIYSTTLWQLQKEVALSALAEDVITQNKTSPITWCVVGNCFSLQKEHENAIKFFQRAVQVDPEFPYSYTLLGHELVLTEELDKALSCFRTAILKDSRHYNAWFGIGTIFSKQERYQLAEIHYRRALKINPKNSVIMVHIGAMQFLLQKPDHALQTLNSAIQIDPKNPLCKFHRGNIYFSMGKHQLALQELEELKQIVPKESAVYYLIGKINKKLGNVDSALMHFSWASDLDPKGANNQIKDVFDSNTTQTNTVDFSSRQDNDTAVETSDADESLAVRGGESEIVPNVYDSDSY